MTLEQLQNFLALQKHMNFSTAAEELYISQSSLSKHIKSLENELGIALFSRSTRNIALTPAGKEFAIYAQKIVDEYTKMLSAVKKFSSKKNHSLCIASIPVMSHYGITNMLSSFKRDNPDVEMNITERETQHIVKSLENFFADLAIMRTKFIPEGNYRVFPLIDDDLVMITGCNHRFASRESIYLSEAVNENYILLNSDTCLYKACIEECSKAGFVPSTTFSSDIRFQTIINFVTQGLGVSLIMKRMAECLADPNIRIIELKEKPVLTLAIVCRDEKLSPLCSNFIDFAVNYFKP